MVAADATVDRVIARYHAAAEVAQTESYRTGSLVRLDSRSGDDVLVSSDLHCQRLHFRRLLQLADLEANAGRHLVMQEVCHGGPEYPQGGCMSHLLLEDVAELKCRYPDRFHFLLSNHELAELTDFPIAKSSRMLNLHFRRGLEVMYGERAEDVREAMLQFLRSCPLAVQLRSGLFISHSAPAGVSVDGFDVSVLSRRWRLEDLLVGGDVFRLVWGRDFSLRNAEAFAQLVKAELMLHGHEPCDEGIRIANPRQVILDSGGPRPRIAIAPLDVQLTAEDLVRMSRPLFPPAAPLEGGA